jgi:hypothetical protein
MEQIIVVTSNKEQQEVVSYLRESLKLEYMTDISISVVQTSMTTVKVLHKIFHKDGTDTTNVASIYKVVIVPISMSLDMLRGLSPDTNININKVLARLDTMKAEVINLVNTNKAHVNRKKFADAAKRLFD